MIAIARRKKRSSEITTQWEKYSPGGMIEVAFDEEVKVFIIECADHKSSLDYLKGV